MHLEDLKQKTPVQLIAMAEEMEIENVASMRKQELMFAILKTVAENDESIFGGGVIEVLQDGFGFLRSPEANYLAGADDIYISPNTVRKYGLRTGDSVDGEISAPRCRSNAGAPNSLRPQSVAAISTSMSWSSGSDRYCGSIMGLAKGSGEAKRISPVDSG